MMTTTSGADVHVEDRRLRRGMKTRGQILNAAIDLFGSRGFAGTSMKDLAAAAGVRAPALYNHFPSKERILAAALTRTLGDFKAHVVDTDDPGRPPTDRLRNLVMAHVAYQVANAPTVRAVDTLLEAVAAGTLLTAEDQREIQAFTTAYRTLMNKLIDEIRAREDLDIPPTPLCVQAVLTLCDQSRSWVGDDAPESSNDIEHECWRLVSGMLRLS